jgi:hypothetical protein
MIARLSLGTAFALAFTLIACGGESALVPVDPAASGANLVTLASDPGEWLGSGRRFTYTGLDAIIEVTATASSIQMKVRGPETWKATFAMPNGALLAKGSYTNVARYPYQGGQAGLSWEGNYRGCSSVTGSFSIDHVTWSAGAGSPLLDLDIHFEQHCDGDAAALRGAIHWSATDHSLPPSPLISNPELWQPPPGAVPATGNYLYIASDPGDLIGGGRTTLFTSGVSGRESGAAAFTVSENDGLGSFVVGTFQVAESKTLRVGLYYAATSPSAANPQLAETSWFTNTNACTSASGWFFVDRVSYDANSNLAGIALRFYYYCDWAGGGLRGAARWGVLPG